MTNNPASSTKPSTKLDRIPILHAPHYWTPWPHEFNRLMLKYQVSQSFFVTLMYLWTATVGSSDDTCGEIALTQIPARRKHVQKWIAALCESGFFEVEKAKLGSQEGSFYSYKESTTPEAWELLFAVLAKIEVFGGLDDSFTVTNFGKMVGRVFHPRNEPALPGESPVPVDETIKQKVAAFEAALTRATRRKRS